MANIVANASVLKNKGEAIERKSEEYKNKIKDFFSILENLNKTCWSGPAADNYVSVVKKQKSTYTAFGNDMKKYGTAIKNAGNNIENCITKWKNK